jgi:hypothetical protein
MYTGPTRPGQLPLLFDRPAVPAGLSCGNYTLWDQVTPEHRVQCGGKYDPLEKFWTLVVSRKTR